MTRRVKQARVVALVISAVVAGAALCVAQSSSPPPETVVFPSGNLSLQGQIYRPAGAGPHPAVLFLHGSEDSYEKEISAVGPLYAANGYLFFVPSRRGQGLSKAQGESIGVRLARERESKGEEAQARLMAQLLKTEQMDDVLAALRYLRGRRDVDGTRVAVAGHSFGGILSVVAAARASGIRAAIASAPAAPNGAWAPELQTDFREAVRRVPVFVFRAENDQNVSPGRLLAEELDRYLLGRRMKIFRCFGATATEGHSFGYFGGSIYAPDVFAFLAEQMDEAWTSIRASAPYEWEGDIDGKAAWTMKHYGQFLRDYPDHVLAADAMFEMAVAIWASAGYPELFHYLIAPTRAERDAKGRQLQQWFDTRGFGGGVVPSVAKPDLAGARRAREMFRDLVAKYPSARPVGMARYYSAVILDYCFDDRPNAIAEYETFLEEHHTMEPFVGKAKRRIEVLRGTVGDRIP
jgi:dienelactone hydrolase